MHYIFESSMQMIEGETSYVRCRSLDDSTCALYDEPLQGRSTRSRPRKRNNYINYIEILTGRQASELVDLTKNRVNDVLTYSRVPD